MADAAELKALVQASGGPQAATSRRLWSVVGEPAIGRSTGSSFTVTFGFLAGIDGSVEGPVDTTPPTTPMVTDDGAFTSSTTQLHATWTSSDPESGITEYQYAIGTTVGGTEVVPWTSTGTATEVTHSGLVLIHNTTYTISVKALNGAGLWSTVGTSNGITVDTTPPSAPGRPNELSGTGEYDGDGNYFVFWSAAFDAESEIAAYELQERIGLTGNWNTLTDRLKVRFSFIRGRLHNTRYFYRVRAQNGAGLLSPWSEVSDGILVDQTSPSPVTVTDEGDTTASQTTLSANWTASLDPESGVVEHQYQITEDNATGPVVVPWTSTGTATEVTHSGLSLTLGKIYYFSVRAKNGAGLWSEIGVSDGIRVDLQPPTILRLIPGDGSTFTEGDRILITATATDTDGDLLEYRFLIDGKESRPWNSEAIFSWDTTGNLRFHTVTVQVRDRLGRQAELQVSLFGYRRAVLPPN